VLYASSSEIEGCRRDVLCHLVTVERDTHREKNEQRDIGRVMWKDENNETV
jgi:hypothetical protein